MKDTGCHWCEQRGVQVCLSSRMQHDTRCHKGEASIFNLYRYLSCLRCNVDHDPRPLQVSGEKLAHLQDLVIFPAEAHHRRSVHLVWARPNSQYTFLVTRGPTPLTFVDDHDPRPFYDWQKAKLYLRMIFSLLLPSYISPIAQKTAFHYFVIIHCLG